MRNISFFLTILFFFLVNTEAFCQELHTTASGQKILIYANGDYEVVARNSSLNDAGQLVSQTTGEDVFEEPTENLGIQELENLAKINQIIRQLERDEVRDYLAANQMKDEIAALKSEKRVAIMEGDEDLIANKTAEIKVKKSQLKAKEELLEEEADELDTLTKARRKDLKNAQRYIKKYELKQVDSDVSKEKPKEILTSEITMPTTKKNKVVVKPSTVSYPRIPYDCKLAFDGYDQQINKKRKEVQMEHFFAYTQENLKPFLKENDFMSCDASLSEVDGDYFLSLVFKLDNKDAAKTYGLLRYKESIRIKLINGESVYGENSIQADGKIEPYSGKTIFKGYYQLSKADIKALKKYEVDAVGVVWSSGYEEYEVFNVDVLLNQAHCLTK